MDDQSPAHILELTQLGIENLFRSNGAPTAIYFKDCKTLQETVDAFFSISDKYSCIEAVLDFYGGMVSSPHYAEKEGRINDYFHLQIIVEFLIRVSTLSNRT